MIAELQTAGVICLETFKDFPQMARFTLRDEGWSVNECGFIDAWYMYVYLQKSDAHVHVELQYHVIYMHVHVSEGPDAT